jgi:ribosomal protein L30
MAKLLITYKKSTIGYAENQKQTVRSLGLKKLHQSVVLPDNAAVRGMIFTVRHLVGVEEVADDYAIPARVQHARPMVVEAPRERPSYQPPVREEAQAPVTASFAPATLAAVEDDEDEAEVPATLAVVENEAEVPATLAVVENEAEAPATLAVVEDEAEAETDDLELIEGIGPKIAEVLREQGIMTFAQLAAMEPEAIKALLDQPNLRLADPETWPEQAGLLAEGRREEFDALVDRLKGGRNV